METPLRLFEKLSIVVNAGRAFVAAIAVAVRAPFETRKGLPALIDRMACAAIRTWTERISMHQRHRMGPSTKQSYDDFVKKQKLPSEVVRVDESGTSVLVIGASREDATHVMLYCHGGGYVGTATAGHCRLLFDTAEEVESKSTSRLRILMLEYVTAPQKAYPYQLQQAQAALRYLTDQEQFNPSQIIVAGDSAGGNLALALLFSLSHLHPSPSISQGKPSLTQPLAGLGLISPWVTFSSHAPSIRTNADVDLLSMSSLDICSAAFLGSSPSDTFTEPLHADTAWLETSLDKSKVSSILLTAGEWELFVDDIVAFAKRLDPFANTTLVVGNGEVHDQPLIDSFFKKKEKRLRSYRAWVEWVVESVGKTGEK